jgi:hypothetical protein
MITTIKYNNNNNYYYYYYILMKKFGEEVFDRRVGK